MPLPSLDNECISNILSLLDSKTLYNCLFVNRYFCKLTIPTIWRNPFTFTAGNSNNLSLINTLLSCLNEDEISSLIPCAINFNNQTPLFEYGNFVRKIDHYYCTEDVRAWLVYTVDYDQDYYQDCRVQKLISAIYNMIMRQGSNLQELAVTLKRNQIDLPKFSTFATYKPGIKNLKSLDIRIGYNCRIEEHQNTIEFLSMVSKFYNGLVSFELWILELNTDSILVKQILDIINLQPLERVSMVHFHHVCKEDVKKFIYTLEFRSVTLKELSFKSLDCRGIDLSFILNLEYLEYLEFNDCRNLTYHEALSKKKLHLKELNLWSEMEIDMIKFLCSETILKLSLRFPTPEKVNIVKETCPNLIMITFKTSFGCNSNY